MEMQLNVEAALDSGVLVANPNYRYDYEKVLSFVGLKGRPSRPLDPHVYPKNHADFLRMRGLLPNAFFDPFNRLLELVGVAPIRVEPRLESIEVWNNDDFLPNLVSAVNQKLDGGKTVTLVPMLVSVFHNLEYDHIPRDEEWHSIGAISIPGSRTYDRPAEAFRAYLRSGGRAALITSGKAPYYDESNNDLDLSEAEANAAYLRLLGVPNDRIYTEPASEDTQENADYLQFALRQIEKDRSATIHSILLVTSPYHLARFRLSVTAMVEEQTLGINVFAAGSRASRYWAETYFMDDDKSGYTRDHTLGVVFNEYLKIAFDVCARDRPPEVKDEAPRTE